MAIRTRIDIPVEGGVQAELLTFTFDTREKGHLAFVFNGWKAGEPRLVRMHSSCVTGDVFGSQLCDCGPQRTETFRRCAEAGGIFLYLNQEGRGIGLEAKIAAYAVQQEMGLDTFEANLVGGHREDERSYAAAAQMLKDIGVTAIRLLTNNPDKVAQLRENGIDVTEVLPTATYANRHNARYIEAKRTHGHTLERG